MNGALSATATSPLVRTYVPFTLMTTSPNADNPSKRSIGMWRRFLNRNGLASFKVKLVGYFLLLALLPLAALFWGFTGVASRSETRLVDARLQAGLRAALGSYAEALDTAERSARSLAATRPFQISLARQDRAALPRV